jgi:hypothetical protein
MLAGVRRITAAATPAAFFVGLALLCSALAELQWLPHLDARVYASDIELTARGALAEVLPADHLAGQIERALLGALVVAVFGVALVLRRRPLAGGVIISAAALFAAGLVSVAALSLATVDPPESNCVIQHDMQLPALFASAERFVLFFSVLAALSWVSLQRQRELVPNPGSVGALTIALAMVALVTAGALALEPALLVAGALACAFAAWALPSRRRGSEVLSWLALIGVATASAWRPGDETATNHSTLTQSIVIALLGGLGVALSFSLPLYGSRLVSTLVLAAGLALCVPALAVAHDDPRHFTEDGWTFPVDGQVTLLSTESCEPPTLGVFIQVTPDEVRVSGLRVASLSNTKQIEFEVFEKLAEMKRQFDDLHAQAGMEPRESLPVTLVAENTPLAVFAAIARGVAKTPTRRIEILSLQRSDPELWTRKAEHRHQCVVPVQLAADARPLSEFSDWPAFVRTADAARGTLKIVP